MSFAAQMTERARKNLVDPVIKRGGSPFAMWASTTVGENALATPFDTGALTPEYRTPFIIESIGMLVSGTQEAGSLQINNPGATVRVRFTAGPWALSEAWVPIWGYGPRLQSTFLSPGTLSADIEATPGRSGAIGGGNTGFYATYFWRLPKPLILPAGITLIPQVQRGIDGMGGTFTVEMIYSGRQMSPDFKVPKEIDVPWVASFLSKEVVGSAPTADQVIDPAFQQSRDRAELSNPFNVPLHVRSMIYRTQTRDNIGPDNIGVQLAEIDATQITLLTSSDRKLIDNLQAGLVFDRTRMAWNVNFDLPPDESLILRIPKSARLNAGGNPGGASPTRYSFSMVGWRKEALP